MFWLLLISTCITSRPSPFPTLPHSSVRWLGGQDAGSRDDNNSSEGYSLSCNIMTNNKNWAQGGPREQLVISLLVRGAEWFSLHHSFLCLWNSIYLNPGAFLPLPHSTGIGSHQTKAQVLSSSPGSTHHRKLHVYSLSAFQWERALCSTWYYSKLFWYMLKKPELTPKLVSGKATMKILFLRNVSFCVLSLVNRGNALLLIRSLLLVRKIPQRGMNWLQISLGRTGRANFSSPLKQESLETEKEKKQVGKILN